MASPAPGTRRPLLVLAVGVPLVAAALAVGLAALRADGDREATDRRTTAPTTAPATVDYELKGRGQAPVRVRLEVAADPEARARGLSGRASLADGAGMVFLFPADTDGPFWMKDTLVPLSIAFVAADGRVVAVREMVPCQRDPCPRYWPGAAYRYAVELPAGSFPRAGVGPGDLVVPLDPGALPTPR
jgi:uncharacterized membrane protein (UPF0127 family)